MASINQLAEDLIFEILSWLPVLSLLRCTSVCKSWKSIISNPYFIQAHLAISQKKQHPFSTLRVVSKSDESQDLFMDTLGENSVKLSLPRYISDVPQLFFRSCNGLVILSDIHVVVLYIWNPLTRSFKLLPKPRVVKPRRKSRLYRLEFVVNFGFGFDSVSNDYKILRVVLVKINLGVEKRFQLVAELYSFNTDSWTVIMVPEEMRGFRQDPLSECVCVGSRVLCFQGTNGILLFNLHNEVFGTCQYPKTGVRMSDALDFEGSIGFILKSSENESIILSLWTLANVGGNIIWTKKFNIEPHMKIDHVLFYLGDGQFLAKDDGAGYIVYHDRKKGTPPLSCVFREFTYVAQISGSLVSLEGFEQQD
ncbi:putative F-box protein At1g33530 [Daucus carota subsp. sativus]|uniref:putative F-box protein At1g33530 n=1 Tax=Daucus carota subsp. sativus TaxID=79200 RepID=UPI0007F02057|nr:PREDICTED: putative F-box protein At1g33530 [Daucus carota subsp. sativus]